MAKDSDPAWKSRHKSRRMRVVGVNCVMTETGLVTIALGSDGNNGTKYQLNPSLESGSRRFLVQVFCLISSWPLPPVSRFR